MRTNGDQQCLDLVFGSPDAGGICEPARLCQLVPWSERVDGWDMLTSHDITWHHIFTGWIRIFNRPTPWVWNVDSQRNHSNPAIQPSWRQAEANDGIDRTCPPEKGCNAHVQCLPDEYLGLARSKYCLKIGTESPLDSFIMFDHFAHCNSHAVAVGVYLLFWDKAKLFVNTSWVTSSGCVVCQGPHVQGL